MNTMEITPANLELANKLLQKAFPGYEPFKIEKAHEDIIFEPFKSFELASDSMPFRIYTDTDMADFVVCEEIHIPGCNYLSNGDPGYPDDSEVKEYESYNHFTNALFNVFTRELQRILTDEIDDPEDNDWEFDE